MFHLSHYKFNNRSGYLSIPLHKEFTPSNLFQQTMYANKVRLPFLSNIIHNRNKLRFNAHRKKITKLTLYQRHLLPTLSLFVITNNRTLIMTKTSGMQIIYSQTADVSYYDIQTKQLFPGFVNIFAIKMEFFSFSTI